MKRKSQNLFIAIIIIIFQYQNGYSQKNENFVLYGEINDSYKGYVYLFYNDNTNTKIKDSIYVNNEKKFQFKGKVYKVSSAELGTESGPMDDVFFIENVNMKINISLEKEVVNEKTTDFYFNLINTTGTKTSILQADFIKFNELYKNDSNWNEKLFNKLNSILSTNPRSNYSAFLLNNVASQSVLNEEQLKILLKKINLLYINKFYVRKLNKRILKIGVVNIGDDFIHFKLPNSNNEIKTSAMYKGSFLLIEFWASWCSPCKKAFPDLLKIYDKYRNSEFILGSKFNIMGVSLDKDKEEWINAMKRTHINWENVIVNQEGEFESDIAVKYGLDYVPANFLISPDGCVVAKNISLEKLEVFLSENLK